MSCSVTLPPALAQLHPAKPTPNFLRQKVLRITPLFAGFYAGNPAISMNTRNFGGRGEGGTVASPQFPTAGNSGPPAVGKIRVPS